MELPGRHTIDGNFSDASAADRMRHRVSVLPCCVMIPDKDDGIIAAIYIADHGIRAAHLAADQLHFRVTVAYQKHYDAAYASHYFNTRRLDAHTVEFCSDDYEEVLRFFHFVL